MMGELLKVDWIEEIKQKQRDEATRVEKDALYKAMTKALAKAEGLERFEGILKEIRWQGVAAAEIGADVKLSDVTRDADRETRNHVFRIDVHSTANRVASSYLDLSYIEGDTKIRCLPSDTGGFQINFRSSSEGKLTMVGPNGELKSDACAAKFILFPLVKTVIAD